MFSFHKPKVYRSSTGCCICKAKSSSSRFTDSKKYEEDFLECFQLANPRQGEICNACVLLVKRWKKLPAGSDRNWRHVVDARAGPGMKSMTKFKSKNKKPTLTADSSSTCEKIEKIMKKKKRKLAERESSPALSDHSDEVMKEDVEMQEVADDFLVEDVVIETEGGRSRTASPGTSDCEDSTTNMLLGGAAVSSRRHKAQAMKRRETIPEVSGFVDLTFWKPRTVCCGTIYEGPNGEVLIDTRILKPCQARLNHFHKDPLDPSVVVTLDTTKSVTTAITPKTDNSDSSSDSGYDESSNPGAEKESYKKDEYLVVETTTEMITSNRSLSNTTNN